MDSGRRVKQQQAPALLASQPSGAPGVVVVYPCKSYNPHGHECTTYAALARRLAAIKDYEFGGDFDISCRYDRSLYFVPTDTLATLDSARELGIHGEQDLFGGVVPYPFIATKTITHPLPDATAYAPKGWSAGFARRVRDVVLPGWSAFTLDDARAAATRLLQTGTVRMKKASGIGGLGQAVIADAAQLEAELQMMNPEELLRDGVVFEQNLSDVVTHSVGQVRVGNLLATYYGTQSLTRNNRGETVYGGSDLTIVRGGFHALLELSFPEEVVQAIAQARVYHVAAMTSFAGMFASRCNYDVIQGVDDQGRRRSGVLEQSWRAGGCSGAEVAALAAFRADPSLRTVRASTTEIYGADPVVPPDAEIYFQGIDERTGPLIKYSRLQGYADSR